MPKVLLWSQRRGKHTLKWLFHLSELLSSFSSSFKVGEWVSDSERSLERLKHASKIINLLSENFILVNGSVNASILWGAWTQSFTIFWMKRKINNYQIAFERGKRKEATTNLKGTAEPKFQVKFCTDIEFSNLITPLNSFLLERSTKAVQGRNDRKPLECFVAESYNYVKTKINFDWKLFFYHFSKREIQKVL